MTAGLDSDASMMLDLILERFKKLKIAGFEHFSGKNSW